MAHACGKAVALLALLPGAAARDGYCQTVLLNHTDANLHQRTLVVETTQRQRLLVQMSASDVGEACGLQWWIDHNPQGGVSCQGAATPRPPGATCDPSDCHPDIENIENGYVRSMLATVPFVPAAFAGAPAAGAGRGGGVATTLLQRRSRSLRPAEPEDAAGQWVARPRAPRRVLVVGLGSSTMALWLRSRLPASRLDVVDIDPGAVAAAPCFGLNVTDTGLHLQVRDGRALLQSSADGTYDAILIDAFLPDTSLPPCFRTQEFFADAAKKLAPGGVLSFNLLNNEGYLRVLASLTSAFGPGSSLWMGRAPGADGVQEVVAAFASAAGGGERSSAGASSSAPGLGPSSLGAAGAWLDSAQFRPLGQARAGKGPRPFSDAEVGCGRV